MNIKQPYVHRVQYYETDKMGVTHHSNYIRFMEEARVAFMEQIGFPYARLEALGVLSPVTGIDCRYLAPTTFDDRVTVAVSVRAFNGVVLTMGYEMTNQDGKRVFTGTSSHCFLNREGHFVRLKREQPEFYALLMQQLEAEGGEEQHE